MNNNVIEKSLAKDFASSEAPSTGSASEEYERLNHLAVDGAMRVANKCELMKKAWTELMPTLDAMQALLSQRGGKRGEQPATELPSWTSWLAGFLNKTQLDVTMRTVQNQLTKFRSSGSAKQRQTGAPLKLTSRQQKGLLRAMQCGNELVSALDSGEDFHSAMEEYKRLAMGPEKIEGLLLESIHATDANPSNQLPVVSLTEAAQKPAPSIAEAAPAQSARPPRLPKPGSWSGLAKYVGDSCGEGIQSALEGLNPVQMASCLQRFVQKLAHMYCIYDRLDGQITVQIEYIRDDVPTINQVA